MVQTSSGQAFLTTTGKTYTGKIKGSEKSFVVITIFDNTIRGLIQDEKGVVHTISSHDKKSNSVIVRKNDESNYNGHNCGHLNTKKSYKNSSTHPYKSNGTCDVPCLIPCAEAATVHVFYELDYIAYIDEGGNIQNCIDFMTATHAVVHNIYNNITDVSNNGGPTTPLAGGVNMIMSGLFIWDTPDPYPNGSLGDRINEFARLRPTFNGDVAHLISKGTIDDGGIANIDLDNTDAAICIDDQNPTVGSPHSLSFIRGADNIDFDINTFSYATALIAHEIGHTLGGRHPHEARWYPDAGVLYSIHNGVGCQLAADSIGPCTFVDDPSTPNIIESYSPTIMSRCWDSGSPVGTIDYSTPFHREIATDILFNLCDRELCYEPVCPDNKNDFDEYCNDDDCRPNDPTLPALNGSPCDDNNPMTVNDRIRDDMMDDPMISCTCLGDLWFNTEEDPCNILIGGDLDFQQDQVGQAEGTWYNAIRTGWTGPPANTPDIGHAIVDDVCDQFIALFGDNNPNDGNIGNREGLAIRLSDPLPCHTGVLTLTISYSSTLNNNTNRVVIQGSNDIVQTLPQNCNTNILNAETYCFGTFLPTSTNCFHNGDPRADFMRANTCATTLQFCTRTIRLNNLSDNDINIIYISFNVNPGDGYTDEYVFLDNISIDIDPMSYGPISNITEECNIKEIQYSRYCTYSIQYEDPEDGWIEVEENIIVLSSDPSMSGDHKMTTDVIDFTFDNCYPHRVVQNCPPTVIDDAFCNISDVVADNSACHDNDPAFMLEEYLPDEEKCAFFDDMIVYVSEWPTSGYSFLWHDGVETDIPQRTFSEPLPGTYTYSLTVTDVNNGCTGTDDIEVAYVDCNTPVSACGKTVGYTIGTNQNRSLLSWIENGIPHTIITDPNTFEETYIIESLDFWVAGFIDIDVNVEFNNCIFYMSRGFQINENMVVTSHSSDFIPCTNIGGGFNVLDGAELYLLDNSLLNGSNVSWTRPTAGIVIRKDNVICVDHSTITNYDYGLFNQHYGPEGIILNVTNSTFSNFDYCAVVRSETMEINSNTVTECKVGFQLSAAMDANIKDNNIQSNRECLRLSTGSFTISENKLESIGSFPFSEIQPSVINFGTASGIITNNTITRRGQGSGIQNTAGRGDLGIHFNDIIAGGTVTFNNGPFNSQTFHYPAIDIDGAFSGGDISNNVITSDASPGIRLSESGDINMNCNNITSERGSRGAIAISIEDASDDAVLRANTLNGYRDLITRSTIDNPFQVHRGNCFNGDGVLAFLSPQGLAESIFYVDPTDDPCYISVNPIPNNLFEIDFGGEAASCEAKPGAYGVPFIEDSTRVCQFLALLDGHLDDPLRRSVAIMRLINLFRTAARSDYYIENPMPKCLTDYLDTTNLCGISLLMQMDTLIDAATTGTEETKYKIQIQSTLTYLLLQQWIEYDAMEEGDSQEEKDRLRALYITELRILQALIKSQREEEEMLWTEIDSIEISECLDSISMIEMKAYKYLSHKDNLSESEMQEIDYYAKKCSNEYGRGIHVMRAIASGFNDIDYRLYDMACEEEIELEQRYNTKRFVQATDKITIIPNPNNGQFVIKHTDNKLLKAVTIHRIDGMLVQRLKITDINKEINLRDTNNGVYYIQFLYGDGSKRLIKMVLTN